MRERKSGIFGVFGGFGFDGDADEGGRVFDVEEELMEGLGVEDGLTQCYGRGGIRRCGRGGVVV